MNNILNNILSSSLFIPYSPKRERGMNYRKEFAKEHCDFLTWVTEHGLILLTFASCANYQLLAVDRNNL